MKKERGLFCIMVLIVVAVSVYNVLENMLNESYNSYSDGLAITYDVNDAMASSDDIPIPSGDLNVSKVILLPDLYEEGMGFTCTGLAYDETSRTFIVGEFGALLPSEKPRGSIVRMTSDFSRVVETIPLYSTITNGVQGVAFDTSDNTIWFCCPNRNIVWHISSSGTNIGRITTPQPTGIAYSDRDDTFWILSYDGNIRHVTKSGEVLDTTVFAYDDTLDQCFLDKNKGLLYITAGTNYSSRNNIYCLNINTQEQYIACTVDSYAVEGIWLGDNDKMIILNDGYFHSARIEKNQVNVYMVSQ